MRGSGELVGVEEGVVVVIGEGDGVGWDRMVTTFCYISISVVELNGG
jgi:hypothetical protein